MSNVLNVIAQIVLWFSLVNFPSTFSFFLFYHFFSMQDLIMQNSYHSLIWNHVLEAQMKWCFWRSDEIVFEAQMKWFLPWRFDEISFWFKLWSELNCFLSYIDHSQWLLCSFVMWPCRWYKLLKCQDWMQIPWKSFYPPKNPFQAGSNSVNLRRWISIFIDAGFGLVSG